MLVIASTNTTKQILLKSGEWVIVDKEKAAEMAQEAEASHLKRNLEAVEISKNMIDDEKRRAMQRAYRDACEVLESEGISEGEIVSDSVDLDGVENGCHKRLSLIATDPRYRPAASLEVEEGASGAPPG